MSKVIDFPFKKTTSLTEDVTHFCEVVEVCLKIKQEFSLLKKKVLVEGIEAVTDQDVVRLKKLNLQLNLLCDIYGFKIE